MRSLRPPPLAPPLALHAGPLLLPSPGSLPSAIKSPLPCVLSALPPACFRLLAPSLVPRPSHELSPSPLNPPALLHPHPSHRMQGVAARAFPRDAAVLSGHGDVGCGHDLRAASGSRAHTRAWRRVSEESSLLKLHPHSQLPRLPPTRECGDRTGGNDLASPSMPAARHMGWQAMRESGWPLRTPSRPSPFAPWPLREFSRPRKALRVDGPCLTWVGNTKAGIARARNRLSKATEEEDDEQDGVGVPDA